MKESYKTTELGFIPSHWEVLPLRGNFDFLPNNTYSRDCLNPSKGDVQNIHYGDVLIKYGSILDCETANIPYINPEIQVNLVKRLVQSGDIVIADTAEDITVGKATEVINVGKKNIVSGLHTVFIRPHSGLFAERFLGYFLNSSTYHDQLLPYIVGTKVSSVSKGSLLETFVLRPPFTEQRRIAEALSDMDALLAAMGKLIAKKRAIKQGAMQELLTGKRRLPGFEGEWVEKPLSEIMRIRKERINPYDYTNTRCIELEHIEPVSGHLLGWTDSKNQRSLKAVFQPNDVLFGKLRPYLRKFFSPHFSGLCSTEFWVFTSVDETIANSFIYHLVQSFRFLEIASSTTGTKMPRADWSLMKDTVFAVPSNKSEQLAIAEILSDIDADINAQNAKLNKLRKIKRGMMSELLTGRIRLVETEPAKAKVVPYLEPKAEPNLKVAEQPPVKGHNQQFDDAVMIAGIVDALYSDKYPLGRKKVQKCLYLLRRHQDESTEAFKKMAAGPYADEVRYKGGEPIARNVKYITTTTTKGKGTTFGRGKDIGKALSYIQSWGKEAEIQWVIDNLKFKKVDELELLATVDMAICDLTEAGTPVSAQSIKHLIATNAEWKAKLEKQTFSDANIARAIHDLKTLLQGEN